MAKSRRNFIRKPPALGYRKLFIIATEGSDTEPEYFTIFSSKTITVKTLPSKKKTSPSQILKRAKKHIAKEGLRKGDEVWLVIDRDTWEEDELNQVYQQCCLNKYSLALSNPKFEYWLLLHFEDGKGVTTINCETRLKVSLPLFSKSHVEVTKLKPRINDAIKRAEQRDNPPCIDWPHHTGTTVYRLVKKLQGQVNG
ncbi:MAG: hypothetical protein A2511_06345 [Deltaproteobacteria bacterium RIFOXYD12_FULL_50_9]|nr:MAG: hypothetical protein A2511_06345 [Deltaproteobacteria bacterium RIFOXYD12_FULL_50_9]